jgi:hypothetical protein
MNKKQFQKDIETKLDNALGHLAKDADKKFRKIVKKASKLFTDVLHSTKPKSVNTAKVTTKSDKVIANTEPKKRGAKKVVKKVESKKKLKP